MPSPMKCWCRNASRARSRRPKPCSAAAIARLSCLSAGRRRHRRRRGDQAERGRPNSAHISKSGERSAGTGRCSSIISCGSDDATPLLIDCNPRLVEPMSAYLAGTDLVGLLLKVSLGECRRRCRKAAPVCGRIWRCRCCWVAVAGRDAARLMRECWDLENGADPMPKAGRR